MRDGPLGRASWSASVLVQEFREALARVPTCRIQVEGCKRADPTYQAGTH